MKGCVVKDSKGEYFLVSPRGGKVALNASEDLAAHLGQQVKASGAFIDTHEPATAAANTASSTSKGTLHPEREFRVLKIDVLSQSCAPPANKRR